MSNPPSNPDLTDSVSINGPEKSPFKINPGFILAAIALSGIAIFAYIVFTGANQNPGEVVYQKLCANCHMDEGEGLRNLIPSLADSDYLRQNQAELPCLILNGISGTLIVNGREFNFPMPDNYMLSDHEMTNLINYINNAWDNDYGRVNIKEVRQTLHFCH